MRSLLAPSRTVLKCLPHLACLVSLIASAPVIAQQGPLSGDPAFVENRGQWAGDVALVGRVGGVTAVLGESGWLLGLEQGRPHADAPSADRRRAARLPRSRCGVGVSMAFEAANSVRPRGEGRHATSFNFFCSEDRSRWRADVPAWKAARYHDLYDGIDVLVHTKRGVLEYDLLVEPGADLDSVRIRCEGISGMEVTADGALLLRTPLGVVRQPSPRTWEVKQSGVRVTVPCRYRIVDGQRFGFAVAGRTPGASLVVDPGIIWSGQLGGFSGYDSIEDVLVHPSGDLLITGNAANDFPTTPGAYSAIPAGTGPFQGNVFVALVTANGTGVAFATFLGGGFGTALALDGTDILVAGYALAGFPTTAGAFQTMPNGGGDAFVARVNGTGTALLASTYLGGSVVESCQALEVGPGGDVIVAGTTESPDFPTTPGAFMTVFNQGNLLGGGTVPRDPFVVRFDSALTFAQYATFVGSSAADECFDMALDPTGRPVLVGVTLGMFPTTPMAFQTPPLGAHDGFVAALDPTGSSLAFATRLGGSDVDYVETIAISPSGELVVGGFTQSLDFPTTAGAWDTTHNGPANPTQQFGMGTDGYVARLDSQGSSLVWSSFLGGSGEDDVRSVVLTPSDAVTVGGSTTSADFPVTAGTYQAVASAWGDTFVALADPYGTRLHYATYLGGSQTEALHDMALDPGGDVVVTGATWSPDWPITPGLPTTTYNAIGCGFFGGPAPCSDGFLTRLDLLPTGVSRFGTATPACGAGMSISVSGLPQAANATFAVTCSGAPPGTTGALFIGGTPDVTGTLISGVQAHVLLSAPWFSLPATSDGRGWSEVAIPIPSGLTGLVLTAQFGWQNTAACGGVGSLSASNALVATIQ